jgi:hypothetical protein
MAAELALGVLTGRDRAAAIAHLEKCKAWREDVRQLMAAGGQLFELLRPAEPPAGFETRALERLGMPAPPRGRSEPRPLPRSGHRRRQRAPAQGGARPGRVRRALAATAMGLAVIAAGLGGWRISAGPSPPSPAAARLTSATLLSATRGSVGNVFLYSGTPRWLYLDVDLGSGHDSVTCQVVGADGRASTVGTFQLEDGYGAWGSPDPGNVGPPVAARLLSANGAVLATATFTD